MRQPRLLTDGELVAEAARLMARLDEHGFDWRAHAREAQQEPADYLIWLILAGRGWGKTRTGSETSKGWSKLRRNGRYAVIAKSHREVRNICFEARSAGLLAVIPPEDVASYNRSPGDVALTLKNGSVFRGFSAEDPDALRGYAFDGAWCDEFAAWPRLVAQDVLDMVMFCLREATDPHVMITTTPKNLPHIRKLVRDAAARSNIVITRGHTKENVANLSGVALQALMDRYEGTRLGRQELGAELLEDAEGAMVLRQHIEAGRISRAELPRFAAVVVAIDPATTAKRSSNETGIITCAVDAEGVGYALADASGQYTPDQWARRAWKRVLDDGAQAVVVEDNAGGDMVEYTLRTVWFQIASERREKYQTTPVMPPIVRVHPAGEGQGKWARAQPISALYEQDKPRVRHLARSDEFTLDGLEDQECAWTGGHDEESPDRVDALVHGLTWLMFPGRRANKGARTVAAGPQDRWSNSRDRR